MKTSELTGVALDWAVAKCEGDYYEIVDGGLEEDCPDYSTDWAYGGPIIERYITLLEDVGDELVAEAPGGFKGHGATPLIAAMRCYVASKLGDEIDVPDGL